ncbi:MAG TPA: endonuclease domain-containing protein [Anaerolineales bacterium]|nr:endonuclease domain-containing protein [Anaerolineales bacterium]
MEKENIITGQKIDPGKLARAKELRRNMTPAEKRLWSVLRGNKLDGFHFRRQQIIDGLIVDFYCHKAGLVVEVDGPVHEIQKEYDQTRTDHLIDSGLAVLRFRNEEVMQELAGVLENIRATCRERVEAATTRT